MKRGAPASIEQVRQGMIASTVFPDRKYTRSAVEIIATHNGLPAMLIGRKRPNVVQRVKAMNFVPETIHSSLVRTVSSVGSQTISGIVREKPTCH